ncbi:MAG TPA: class I SAM-dependent methyltransferase [Solirubrobacteraceae bacterium]|jgi:SAM-dependent methyltransferase
MRPEAYAEMRALEERHWWFRGRRALLHALLRRMGAAERARVLDAGCGTGRNLLEFGGVGVDPAPEAVAACRARGLDVVQAGLDALPFDTGSFDLLLATDVLEHVDDDAGALRELRRVAAPGAVLLVTVPAHPSLWSGHDEALHHRRRYRRAELLGRMRAAGWEPVVVTWWNCLLLPVVALARRRPGGAADHNRTPGWADRVLVLPLAVEAWLVGRGVRLPAGVSLAVAAQPKAQA